jgi:hypothetical protein
MTDFEKHLARVPWWRRFVIKHDDGGHTVIELPVGFLVGLFLCLLGLVLLLVGG